MSSHELESIVGQVQRLTPEEQLELIRRVTDLIEGNQKTSRGRRLVFGKYKDAPGPMSTEEDFLLAEWLPTERDLNGP